jgi:hypothetical protein
MQRVGRRRSERPPSRRHYPPVPHGSRARSYRSRSDRRLRARPRLSSVDARRLRQSEALRELGDVGLGEAEEEAPAGAAERDVQELAGLLVVLERVGVEVRNDDHVELLAFALVTRQQRHAAALVPGADHALLQQPVGGLRAGLGVAEIGSRHEGPAYDLQGVPGDQAGRLAAAG